MTAEISTSPMDPDRLEHAQQHIENNIVAAKEGRKCVDGRYGPDQGTGFIARPGADFGYVMVLLALNRKYSLGLTPADCVDRIYYIVTKDGTSFSMHTDHHADPEMPEEHAHDHDHDKPMIGCAHIAKATDASRAEEYSVIPDDIKQAVVHAKSKPINFVNLGREHQEQGVMVVHGTSRTVNPYDPERNTMYFIYNPDRDNRLMDEIVDQLEIPQINKDEFKQFSGQQLQATLRNVALGKPIFDVDLTDGKPQVTFAGVVEEK